MSHTFRLSVLTSITLGLLATSAANAGNPPEFASWPSGAGPAEIGKRVSENFVVRKFRYETTEMRRRTVIYPEVCAWYGALNVAQLTADADLQNRLVAKYDILRGTEGEKHLPMRAHVDDRVFGAVPFEIFLQTKDPKFLEVGKGFADAQWATTSDDGITTEARYWIDDMYMISAVQAQAYRATGDMVYLDRAALAMGSYLDRLQQPNGLFFHAPDSPFFWSRGNGWFAAGMTELLRVLPANHPKRERVMRGYLTMMESLLKYQGEDGLWKQLVDVPESWPETSGTGMFAFAMVTGVKEGWLDAGTYAPAARKAWLGLVSKIDDAANIHDVCIGTNKGYSVDYYLAREKMIGDLHGQAPVLWTAAALLR